MCTLADKEEQDDDNSTDGGHDITRCVSDNVLHLQRRLLAVLPAVTMPGSLTVERLHKGKKQCNY